MLTVCLIHRDLQCNGVVVSLFLKYSLSFFGQDAFDCLFNRDVMSSFKTHAASPLATDNNTPLNLGCFIANCILYTEK